MLSFVETDMITVKDWRKYFVINSSVRIDFSRWLIFYFTWWAVAKCRCTAVDGLATAYDERCWAARATKYILALLSCRFPEKALTFSWAGFQQIQVESTWNSSGYYRRCFRQKTSVSP